MKLAILDEFAYLDNGRKWNKHFQTHIEHNFFCVACLPFCLILFHSEGFSNRKNFVLRRNVRFELSLILLSWNFSDLKTHFKCGPVIESKPKLAQRTAERKYEHKYLPTIKHTDT